MKKIKLSEEQLNKLVKKVFEQNIGDEEVLTALDESGKFQGELDEKEA